MLSSIGKKVKGSRAKESLIEAEDRKLEDICPRWALCTQF